MIFAHGVFHATPFNMAIIYSMLVQTGAAIMLSLPVLNLLDITFKVWMPVESVRHWAATRLALSLLS